MSEPIKTARFLSEAPEWRIVSDGACAFFETSSLAQSAAFVDALAKIPNQAHHQFGIDLRRAGVTIRVVTLREDFMGMTDRDLELANAVSVVAKQHGLKSDPSRIQSLLIVPGAPNITEVTPFCPRVRKGR